MRIPLVGLPHTGRIIHTSLPKSVLNERLNGDNRSIFVFTSEVSLRGSLAPRQAGAEFRGTYSVQYSQECSRCLEPKERELSRELICLFRDRGGLKVEEEDDIGLILLDDGVIDLGEAVYEDIIIALDIFWSPEVDASGRCRLCGIIQQTEEDVETITGSPLASFGELLSRAKKKK